MTIALRLAADFSPERLKHVPGPVATGLLARLAYGPLPLHELHATYNADLAAAYAALQQLWMDKAIELLNRANRPDVALQSSGSGEALQLGLLDGEGPWRLSRFAYARRDGASLRLESPRGEAVLTILEPHAAGLLVDLLRPVTSADLLRCKSWLDGPAGVDALLCLLRAAMLVDPCDAEGHTVEDIRSDLQQWEFHDLLFHYRSRQGRHDAPLGATFRFRGRLDPQPAVKPNRWSATAIPLQRPSPATILAKDPPFSTVLESRRSIRAHNDARPITLESLSEFLFRAARNRYRYMTDLGEFASRPYPTGGASYEAEVYVTVNQCAGLERGFYYYDPEGHALCFIEPANADLEAMLDGAWVSSAGQCRPQVLLTIASRFQRVAWKYSGMAYATQLKNVGVLYQTFYLVATAMNLAACGLGLGDTARFCRLAHTNYFEEGSIGEFMLGNPA